MQVLKHEYDKAMQAKLHNNEQHMLTERETNGKKKQIYTACVYVFRAKA